QRAALECAAAGHRIEPRLVPRCEPTGSFGGVEDDRKAGAIEAITARIRPANEPPRDVMECEGDAIDVQPPKSIVGRLGPSGESWTEYVRHRPSSEAGGGRPFTNEGPGATGRRRVERRARPGPC